eukprot:Seg5965.2 transcript_id=Seg5965.2/GoldUCD/mRNA.D3Y31 product="hypothetical protein" protein_id=Seg5965.2/GoldUCD/D3Y31
MKSLFILCISICCLVMALAVTVAEKQNEGDHWDSTDLLDKPAHIAMPASRRRSFVTRRRMVVTSRRRMVVTSRRRMVVTSRRRSSRISVRFNARSHRNDSNNGHLVQPSQALTTFGILAAILMITKRLFKYGV